LGGGTLPGGCGGGEREGETRQSQNGCRHRNRNPGFSDRKKVEFHQKKVVTAGGGVPKDMGAGTDYQRKLTKQNRSTQKKVQYWSEDRNWPKENGVGDFHWGHKIKKTKLRGAWMSTFYRRCVVRTKKYWLIKM